MINNVTNIKTNAADFLFFFREKYNNILQRSPEVLSPPINIVLIFYFQIERFSGAITE